ncbi:hypothetical protein L1987_48426 [Smallanthus sonchifolius]|uniref:Uncharacterized protein n=1 Tax=Smallanthus sonchifolius TaxID=185202 RepID=A0ACB9FRZ6_9ASTR|nr:hypothetical protein L1987_48426 [Smallanthus sonchifolius]
MTTERNGDGGDGLVFLATGWFKWFQLHIAGPVRLFPGYTHLSEGIKLSVLTAAVRLVVPIGGEKEWRGKSSNEPVVWYLKQIGHGLGFWKGRNDRSGQTCFSGQKCFSGSGGQLGFRTRILQ